MKWIKGLLWTLLMLFLVVAAFAAAFVFGIDRTNGKLISSGQEREYLLYVPPGYDPQTPVPLVISIHGFSDWPAHHMAMTGWNDLADEVGFLVVYPAGVDFPRRWRASGQSNETGDALVDVRFISDLIDELEQDYAIDPTRIYVNGMSNGGGMTYLLACKLSERIAAVGGVAGAYLYPLEDCLPERPVPLIAFHGTTDPIVPFSGGPSRSFEIPFPVIPDWMAAYAVNNGCNPIPAKLPEQGAASGVAYGDCDAGADVVFYTIEGGGHTWPGGEPLPVWLTGPTTVDVNATRLMWGFFMAHPLEP
jgi:polyhydroxybutyrate depolymerase